MDCYSFIEETAHHDAGRHTYRVPRDLAADEAILCAGKMIAVLNVKFYQALPHAIPGAARPGNVVGRRLDRDVGDAGRAVKGGNRLAGHYDRLRVLQSSLGQGGEAGQEIGRAHV